jgi:polysaccharide pyruvyl transferase WcaK-like protein
LDDFIETFILKQEIKNRKIIVVNFIHEIQDCHIFYSETSNKNSISNIYNFLESLLLQDFSIIAIRTACDRSNFKSFEKFDNFILISEILNLSQLATLYSNVYACIATRLHASIASISYGVPTIGLAYGIKHYDFFKSVNMEEYVVPYLQSSTLSDIWKNLEINYGNIKKTISYHNKKCSTLYVNETNRFIDSFLPENLMDDSYLLLKYKEIYEPGDKTTCSFIQISNIKNI